jgi:hypothetical protein
MGKHVVSPKQKQALAALLLLYEQVLNQELGIAGGLARE